MSIPANSLAMPFKMQKTLRKRRHPNMQQRSLVARSVTRLILVTAYSLEDAINAARV
jgi:hypothetical protein